MSESVQKQVEQFKEKIIKENRKNPYKRRLFSHALKKSIILFVQENNISQNQACKMLGLHPSSIKNWEKKYSSTSFRLIKKSKEIDQPTKPIDLKNNYAIFLMRIVTIQIVQLLLLALMIILQVISHLTG